MEMASCDAIERCFKCRKSSAGARVSRAAARMNDDERFLQDVKHYLFNYNLLSYLENLG